jgi:hypothetical protein
VLSDLRLAGLGLLLAGSPVACRPAGRAAPAVGAPAQESPAAITAWARRVDRAAARLSSITFDLPSSSTEGGTLVAHLQSDTLRRLEATFFGETGRAIERYYVTGNVLHLSVRLDERYDRPLSGRVVARAADSVWFVGETAIRWVDSLGRRSAADSPATRTHGTEARRAFHAVLGLTSQGYRR